MNKKQAIYILFLIWSIFAIGIVVAGNGADEGLQYVSGQIGEWIVALTIIADAIIALFALIDGLFDIYERLGKD
jgi:hypothetical protein